MNAETRKQFKLLRIERDIKQKDIASQLNISASLLSQFENNKRTMPENLVLQYMRIIENLE